MRKKALSRQPRIKRPTFEVGRSVLFKNMLKEILVNGASPYVPPQTH